MHKPFSFILYEFLFTPKNLSLIETYKLESGFLFLSVLIIDNYTVTPLHEVVVNCESNFSTLVCLTVW